MDYQCKKEVFPVCETVFEGTSEQPVDLELSLPDYCPDIERILKCRLCPSVSSKNISGDRLDVDGMVLISLYYLDSKKQAVRVCEHTSPFSCSFDLKCTPVDPVSRVKLKTDYLNCRALSPRRIDIHGAFSVCAGVYARTEQEYCTDIEGDDIQQKKHTEGLSRLCGTGQQQFSITEVLDIGQGKGLPESIIRNELSIKADSCKALTDKIMLSGEAALRILYVTDIESGALETMSFNIPFTQVLDVRGVTETTHNEVMLEVLNYDTSLRSEYDESSTLVTLDARISAAVIACEDAQADIIDDAYSTLYELEPEIKPYRFDRLVTLLDETFSAKGEVSTGDNGITKMIDLWCDNVNNINNAVTHEGDALTLKGKLNCCILALDSEGVPFYVERPVEFSFSPTTESSLSDADLRGDIGVTSLSFRITGDNTLEIKAELKLTGSIHKSVSCPALTGARAADDRMRKRDKAAALTLYYADKGESLWDIARLYCTSVEAIRLENEMTEDVTESGGMILIPN